ncbi:hypothetical protein B7463_g5483, partial [Scytalidium lignicola]
MAKRKADSLESTSKEPRRSSRRKPSLQKEEDTIVEKPSQPDAVVEEKVKKVAKTNKKTAATANEKKGTSTAKPVGKTTANAVSSTDKPAGRQYWLMKAEPESRLEKGVDIKFSIDDLATKTEPEPWDGIRAYPARNNLRAMKKGDLAFFYHSSCKVPSIVGIMEIVQEHSPDSPYYDPSSKPDDPKWSVVHVSFRQKLETPITLKDLRELQAQKDSPLANMQMLKLTRLSVSKVSAEEWEFLTGLMEKNGDKIMY